MRESVAIIIPTFNSEGYIKEFLTGAQEVIRTIEDTHFYFLFVDDGSSDGTVEELKRAREIYSNISILVFTKNYGQTQALLAGLKHTKADAYILMSVDMQESPVLISDFIKSWHEGYKLCIAYRKYRSDNLFNRFISKIFYTIIRIDKPAIPKGGFDYGLIDQIVADDLLMKPANFRWLQGDIMDLGYEPKYFPCERVRAHLSTNKVNFSLFKFNYFFDGIINVVRLPFKIILLLSMLLTIGITAALMYKGIKKFVLGDHISAVQFNNLAQWLVLSLLLLLVSFVIEFAYRIFEIVTNKKDYVVKEFIR